MSLKCEIVGFWPFDHLHLVRIRSSTVNKYIEVAHTINVNILRFVLMLYFRTNRVYEFAAFIVNGVGTDASIMNTTIYMLDRLCLRWVCYLGILQVDKHRKDRQCRSPQPI